jgi:hypothetical protein
MPSKKDAHVSGSRSEGYRVTVGGKPVAKAPTQSQAIDKARDIARANESELYVHRAHGPGRGQIRERDTEGHDPYPPKG